VIKVLVQVSCVSLLHFISKPELRKSCKPAEEWRLVLAAKGELVLDCRVCRRESKLEVVSYIHPSFTLYTESRISNRSSSIAPLFIIDGL